MGSCSVQYVMKKLPDVRDLLVRELSYKQTGWNKMVH